jgi:hypothetical protein
MNGVLRCLHLERTRAVLVSRGNGKQPLQLHLTYNLALVPSACFLCLAQTSAGSRSASARTAGTRSACRFTLASTLQSTQSTTNNAASRTTQFLGDFDAATGRQVADVPVGMDPPARRPVSPTKWSTMARDSLRPEPEEVAIGTMGQKRGWVRKAVGRPPLQSWAQRIWLFLQVLPHAQP